MRHLLIFWCILSSSLSLRGDGITWAGISDTHYGGTPWTWEQGTNAYGSISNEVRFIVTNYIPNFLVHAGDVGESTDLSVETYLTNMLVIPTPRYEAAGNHDVANGIWTSWTNHFSRQKAWTNGNYVFIAIGSYIDPGTGNGHVDTFDIDVMGSVLTNSYPTYTNFVVVSHFSMVTNASFGAIAYGHGFERMTNLFDQFNVILYMHGHQHSVDNVQTNIDGTGTWQQMVPSLTRYLADRGAYQLFYLTNTTLISRRYRTDTHALVSSITNIVPQYIADWPRRIYHVKTSGSDANPGTSDLPFLTVQKGVDSSVGGDKVLVYSGTFSEVVSSTRNGTNLPIVVDGQGLATMNTLALAHSNIWCNNFTINGPSNLWRSLVYIDRAADFCVLSNNIIDANTNDTHFGVFRWNAGATTPFGDAGSDNLIISNIIKRGIGMPMVTIYGDRNVIQGNRLLDSDTVDWFRLWGRTNRIVGNLCSNLYESGVSGNHADFVQTFGNNSYGCQGNIIERNLVIKEDGDAQLGNLTDDSIAEINDLTFQNNIFIGVSAKISCAMPGVKFYNNIFIRCSTNTVSGGHVLNYGDVGAVGKGNSGRVMNNVFLDCGEASITAGWYQFDSTLTNLSADYNFVAKNTYSAVTVNALHQRVGDGAWDNNKLWEDHGINGGNPVFVSESGFDYRTQSGSFLINSGTNSSVVADYFGTARPLGSALDIGIYEFPSVEQDRRITVGRIIIGPR